MPESPPTRARLRRDGGQARARENQIAFPKGESRWPENASGFAIPASQPRENRLVFTVPEPPYWKDKSAIAVPERGYWKEESAIGVPEHGYWKDKSAIGVRERGYWKDESAIGVPELSSRRFIREQPCGDSTNAIKARPPLPGSLTSAHASWALPARVLHVPSSSISVGAGDAGIGHGGDRGEWKGRYLSAQRLNQVAPAVAAAW